LAAICQGISSGKWQGHIFAVWMGKQLFGSSVPIINLPKELAYHTCTGENPIADAASAKAR